MLDLSHDRWQRIDGLFTEALDCQPDERTAFLRAACGDDPALYTAVASLVERADRAELDLGESATDYAAPLLEAGLAEEAALELAEGTRIGPYRVIRPLGRGGMGVVYLAERADGTFEKQVALKLVKRGMDTDAVLRRFHRERQILASLDHPGIARLLDAGATDDGRPYLVMEAVAGEPITAYAEHRQLDVDARLDLFAQVCTAAAYAHRRLVVHRDLKPSNVLVTDDGRAKLLDFGIARLLDPDSDALATQLGSARPLTPAYAAPEQLRGEIATTAADVYALGGMLYELVTGERPASSLKPPSAVAGTARIRRLQGDLDTICLKALRQDPEARYSSVNAMLDDIQRERAGLPIQARPASTGYRVWKFVRRHPRGVWLTLVGLAMLIGAGLFHTVRVNAERDRAELEANKAAAVSSFLVDLLQDSNPNHAPGGSATVREALDEGAARVRTDLRDQPALQAQVLTTMGEVYYGLGLYGQAAQHVEDALAIQRDLYAEPHLAIAASLRQLGGIRQAQSRPPDAYGLCEEALRIHRTLLGSTHAEVAASLQCTGMALRWLDREQDAEQMLREAVAIRRQDAPSLELAQTLTHLGHLLRSARPAEADTLYREALDLRRQLVGNEHPYIADALINVAGAAMRQGRYTEAERYFTDGLAMRRRTQGEDHPEIGVDLGGLARVYRETGDVEAAEQTHREAIAHLNRTLGSNHEEVIVNLYALTRLLLADGRPAEAESTAREALAGRQALHPTGEWLIAEAESLLGATLMAQGRTAEAEPLLRSGYEGLLAHWGPENDYTVEARARLRSLPSQ
ncbi:MAG: hypothetical protein Rubg2KO_30020 [Rubricoccaceae bacterium]